MSADVCACGSRFHRECQRKTAPTYRDFHASFVAGTFHRDHPRPEERVARQCWNRKVRRAASWAGEPSMLELLYHRSPGRLKRAYTGETQRYRCVQGAGGTTVVMLPLRALGVEPGDYVDVAFEAHAITIARAADEMQAEVTT